MDWNWFFSSVAQSVAALVGIFAAFIITKVINSQVTFKNKESRLKELLAVAERHREAIGERYFDWYNKRRLESFLKRVEREIEKNPEKSAEEYYTEFSPPRYMRRDAVIERTKEFLKNQISQESLSSMRSVIRTSQMISVDQHFEDRLSDQIDAEEQMIAEGYLEIKQHIRLVRLHLEDVKNSPESSTLVSNSIIGAAVLFLAGVIFPLSFLPVQGDPAINFSLYVFWSLLLSLKGIMLVVVTIIFLGILTMFWAVNRSLKYTEDDLRSLQLAASLDSYSPYLQAEQDNIVAIREWQKLKDSTVAHVNK